MTYKQAVKLARRIAWHYLGKHVQVRPAESPGVASLDGVTVMYSLKNRNWYVQLFGANEDGVQITYVTHIDEIRAA